MSRLVLALPRRGVMATTSTAAAARPNTSTMSLRQAAATVARAGAIVLSTGAFIPTTASSRTSGFCLPGELTRVPASRADHSTQRNCPIGYVCRQSDPFNEH